MSAIIFNKRATVCSCTGYTNATWSRVNTRVLTYTHNTVRGVGAVLIKEQAALSLGVQQHFHRLLELHEIQLF